MTRPSRSSRPSRRLALTLAGFAALALEAQSPLRAATFTYTPTTTGNTDQWTAGTNWTPGAPVSSTSTELNFSVPAAGSVTPGRTFTSNNNNAGNFLLNILDLAGTGSTAAFPTTLNITGNPLEFGLNGSLAPVVNLTALIGTGSTTLSTLTYNVANNLTLDSGITFTGAGTQAFNFNGIISDGTVGGAVLGAPVAATLTKSGASTLTLNGQNTYSGGTFITGNPGSTASTIQTTIGGGTAGTPSTPFGSGAITLNNGTVALAALTSTAAGAVYVNNAGGLVYSGADTIKLTANSTLGTVTFTTNSLTSANGTDVLQLAPTTGTTLGTTERVFVGTAPTLTNGIVSPSIIDRTTQSFLTYDSTKGFSDAAFVNSTSAAALLAGANANSIVNYTGANAALTTTVYGLKIANNLYNGTALIDTFNITGGGLLFNGTGGNQNSENFNFGANHAYIGSFGSGTFSYGGTLTGTGGATIYGTNAMYLGSSTAGSFALTGGITVDGLLNLNSAGANVINPNNTLTIGRSGVLGFTRSSQAFLSLSGEGAATASAAATLTINGGAGTGTTTFSGQLLAGSAALSIAKSGLNTQILTGTNTYTGSTTVDGGTLVASGAGTFGASPTVTAFNGGTLTLDNTGGTVNRILDTATLAVAGNFNLINGTETVGALTEGGGPAVITLTPATGGTAQLTVTGAVSRSNGSTPLYRGTGLSGTGANTSNVFFTTPLTVSAVGVFADADGSGTGSAAGAGTLGTTSAAVLRGALFDNTATGGGMGFATYDSTGGVRLLNGTTEQDTSGTYPTANSSTNVRLGLTAPVAITGVQTNTLQLDNNSGSLQTVTNTGTAFNPQNGLLFTGNSPITLAGGTLTMPATAAADFVVLSTNTSAAGVTITSAFNNNTSSTGLALGGTGNFTLGTGTGANLNLVSTTATVNANRATVGILNVNTSGTVLLATQIAGGNTNGNATSYGSAEDIFLSDQRERRHAEGGPDERPGRHGEPELSRFDGAIERGFGRDVRPELVCDGGELGDGPGQHHQQQ